MVKPCGFWSQKPQCDVKCRSPWRQKPQFNEKCRSPWRQKPQCWRQYKRPLHSSVCQFTSCNRAVNFDLSEKRKKRKKSWETQHGPLYMHKESKQHSFLSEWSMQTSVLLLLFFKTDILASATLSMHFSLLFQAFYSSVTNCFTFSDRVKQRNLDLPLLSRILYFKICKEKQHKNPAPNVASACVTS